MSYENFPIAVVDNGGQWTHREYRVLNYLGCRAEIISNVTPIEELDRFQALVLSGGAPRIESESEALGLTSEYLDLENLNFLIGRLRWRENIEILDSLSWYQPLKAQDEYTYHYDQENNLSLYLNIYESRFLHLDLKAFVGQLDFDETITEFIDEDRSCLLYTSPSPRDRG